MLEVVLLGTGATMLSPHRFLTAAALRCQGRWLLFDCGEGTQAAMRLSHVSALKLDLIALTHYHGDHIFGLPGLLQTMNCLGRVEPLSITGPEGLEEAMAPVLTLAGDLPFPLHLVTVPKSGLPLRELSRLWPAGAMLEAVPTAHRVPSQGYVFRLARPGLFDPEAARALNVPVELWGRLQRGEAVLAQGRAVRPDQVMGPERPGLSVAVSGDTRRCPELEEAARGADLLIHEATYGDEESMARRYGHSTFAQAGDLAARAGVKRLWLSHFSHTVLCPEDCLPLAAERFPGAECGRDGMRLNLAFPEGTKEGPDPS